VDSSTDLAWASKAKREPLRGRAREKQREARREQQPSRCAEGPISKGQVPKNSPEETQDFKTQDARRKTGGRCAEVPISRCQVPKKGKALGKSGARIKRGVHWLDMVHGFHPWLHAFAPLGLETSDPSSYPIDPIHPGPNSRLFPFVPFAHFVVPHSPNFAPFAPHRSPITDHRSPPTIHHLPSSICHRLFLPCFPCHPWSPFPGSGQQGARNRRAPRGASVTVRCFRAHELAGEVAGERENLAGGESEVDPTSE
jgi:hypothetical protein